MPGIIIVAVVFATASALRLQQLPAA